MEFWQDERKIAFTTNPNGMSFALDTWEENSLGHLQFKFTASFVSEIDARLYLTAKYPLAVEKLATSDEQVASSLCVPRPKPPHDLRDDEAWHKYRQDSRNFRAAIEDAALILKS
jgi:hypothetical protein